MKVKDVITAIKKDGWIYRNTTGDHHHYKKHGERHIITVPGKPSDEVSPGVLAAIRRTTGLPLR